MLAVTAGLAGSEGGSPLSRDGALLYSRAPGGVVLWVSWSIQVEGGSPLSILLRMVGMGLVELLV